MIKLQNIRDYYASAGKRKKKTPLQLIKKRLDVLWSKVVRQRDGRCVLCGVSAEAKQLYAHHWIRNRAGSLATRWLLGNGSSVCFSCHHFKVHASADMSSLDAIKDYMIPRFLTVDGYEEIKRLGVGTTDISMDDLVGMEMGLKVMLESGNE